MHTLKYTDLAELPSVVDITTAARALGLSRTYAYQLAKNGEFPCKVLRIGNCYRVPTAALLHLLHADHAMCSGQEYQATADY
ncbi:helix-turn-helix domain-containing protein [Actinomadura sp. NPDC047616]|uniref:helix-turn-helix domain-containing protein n=1 Tax=Actinomadura sp. NPDC047616 TaxID=3155914 RepID=UPI0033CA3774